MRSCGVGLGLKNSEKGDRVRKLAHLSQLTILQKYREFYNAYKMAKYRVCDGQILMYSLQSLGTAIKEKISGSDLLPTFYEYHKNNPNINR